MANGHACVTEAIIKGYLEVQSGGKGGIEQMGIRELEMRDAR